MNQTVLMAALVAGAYFVGRYSAPEKVKIETVTVTKEVMVQDESSKVNQSQRIIETVTKDGRPIKKTIIKTRSASERKTEETRDIATREHREIENRRGVTLGPLVGLHTGTTGILYGFHANVPIAGPLNTGGSLIASPTFGLAILFFLGLQL